MEEVTKAKKYERYYRPLGSNVMILPIEERKTRGKVILKDQDLPPIVSGVIVNKGPGTPSHQMQTRIRDKVIYSRGSGKRIIFNQTEFVIIPEQQILAII